eukprot:ctg_840.g190
MSGSIVRLCPRAERCAESGAWNAVQNDQSDSPQVEYTAADARLCMPSRPLYGVSS